MQVTNYKCPACTAPLHFSSETGKLECDYCGSHFTVEEVEAFYAEKMPRQPKILKKKARRKPGQRQMRKKQQSVYMRRLRSMKANGMIQQSVKTGAKIQSICVPTTARAVVPN